MPDPDFWDFMLEGGYDLLFPDVDYDCPNCGRTIKGSEKVEWVDKNKQIFKCPEYKQEIKLDAD